MIGTTEPCTRSAYPDTSIVLHREHEAGFLLPQFMGALASETSAQGMTDGCQSRSDKGLLSRLFISVIQRLLSRE